MKDTRGKSMGLVLTDDEIKIVEKAIVTLVEKSEPSPTKRAAAVRAVYKQTAPYFNSRLEQQVALLSLAASTGSFVAAKFAARDCDNNCQAACTISCVNACNNSCKGSCDGSCKGSCDGIYR